MKSFIFRFMVILAIFFAPLSISAQATVEPPPNNVMLMTKINLNANPNARIITTKDTKNSEYTTPQDIKDYATQGLATNARLDSTNTVNNAQTVAIFGKASLTQLAAEAETRRVKDSILQANYNYGQPVIGEVKMFSGANVPQYHLIADGRMLKKSQYSALYAQIGGQYGENTDSFALPNLINKFVRGGTNRGAAGGADNITIVKSNLPLLSVDVPVNTDGGEGDSTDPTKILSADGSAGSFTGMGANALYSGSPIPVTGTGSNTAIPILPSYIVLSYIIRVL
jgi:microcystin-dependent protein